MSADPYSTINTRVTPQNRPADPAQIRNAAGGYVFAADDLTRFRRFLATGTEGGTFYASEKDHTTANAEVVLRLARDRGPEMLDVIYAASTGGHTVKQNPLMLSYAALVSLADDDTRKAALGVFSDVVRTGTHLFLFARYVRQFRGWGRGLRRAVASWYTERDLDGLAYQVAKYGAREGYSHRDMLRLAHPKVRGAKTVADRLRALGPDVVLSEQDEYLAAIRDDALRTRVFDHITGREPAGDLPGAVGVKARLHAAEGPADVMSVIAGERSLSWEMVPSEHLANPDVWRALLDAGHVPLGALLRNLGRLTALGVLDPMGIDDRTSRVMGRLIDAEGLAKARIHPMSVLLAAATYKGGRSVRGDSTWRPVGGINKALDLGFSAAFGAITPEPDVRAMICLDVSDSMNTHMVAGLPGLSCRDAGAALAQQYAATFPRNMGLVFTGHARSGQYSMWDRSWGDAVTPFDFDPTRRLVDVIAETKMLDFGRTDCSLPVLDALERKVHVDTFIVITDNETWAGKMHPHQALRQYRERTGIPARMVTVAMQANDSTIADPNDPGMLDVVGLDSSTVNLVADFAAGRI